MIETPSPTASDRRPRCDPAAVAALEPPRVIVLVPAYREVDSLPHVLEALRGQTRPADRVVVTLDPHRDSGRTAELERIAHAAGAEVWHSVGNRHKKAGNLNGALGRLLPYLSDQDAILVQDADTYLDPHFIEVTLRKMGQGFGAVGGNFSGRSGGRPVS